MMLTVMLSSIGSSALQFVVSCGQMLVLWLETIKRTLSQIISFRFRWRETIDQCYSVAVQSVPIIVFSLTFTSLMLILEFSYHMKLVLMQDSLVPSFATVLMLRELGPVLTCLLLTSRVGAAIAAEIGTMKITDQLDALRQLAIHPIEFLTIPRWIGCVMASVTLSLIAVGTSIVGGSFIAALKLHYPYHQYFNTMFIFIEISDFKCTFLKAVVFGTIIPIVASHYGFTCEGGAQGVGNSATRAVVQASLLIILADLILTYLLYAG